MGKILIKIKEFFKKLIFKNKVKQLEEPKKDNIAQNKFNINENQSQINLKQSRTNFDNQTLKQENEKTYTINEYSDLSEKERIFQIYTEVKNDTVDFSKITREDLLKIRRLLLEESKIQDERFGKDIEELKMYGGSFFIF